MHGIVALSPPTPHGLPLLPFSIPRKPTGPKAPTIRNEGAIQEHLRSWGILISFPSALPITPFITRWWEGNAKGVPLLPMNEALQPANNKTPDTMSTVAAYAPLLTRTPQVSIRGKLWYATRLSCRIPIEVFVDAGAGGGGLCVTDLYENRPD